MSVRGGGGASGTAVGAQVVAVAVFTVSPRPVCSASWSDTPSRRIGWAQPWTVGRAWLEANNHVVMAMMLLVMGAVVLGKGIGGL